MAKECALNELSILDIDTRHHDVFALLDGFVNLCRIAGVPRISLWQDLTDNEKEACKPYNEMLRAAAKESQYKKEQWRRIRRFLDKAESFSDDVQRLEDVRCDGTTARGLVHALRLRGLALSLDSNSKWRASSIPVEIRGLDERSEDWGAARTESVRHAAVREHLAEHDDWTALEEKDRLRIRLEVFPVNHVRASEYKGKHVKGTTNEQRHKNARCPAGVNQYLAERGGAAVTDEVIAGWEKEVLDRVKEGGDCYVEFHGGNTFHVYCNLGTDIGYDSSTGELVSWIRVEWTTSGAVHSHPRRPPDNIRHTLANV